MDFFLSLLGGLFGILIAICIIAFIIYWKIKSKLGNARMHEITNAVSNISRFEQEEYSRVKDVKGLTKVLEPEIIRDFHDFNTDLLYSICESNYRKIFNALESKDCTNIKSDSNLVYIEDQIIEQIKDMNSDNTYERYDNIEFNRHAICGYTKKNGKATVKLSSSLSYYYKTNRKDKKTFPNIKKQTRYTSEFVYVYDEAEIKKEKNSFSVQCPNCGAPLRGLEGENCEYCGAHLEKINLKVWKMSSYSEDYK